MTIPENKRVLPILLLRLNLKLSALFLQKLFLFEREDEQETSVGHYDLQCEGVEMLVGFLKTKYQNVLLKAFTRVKEYKVGGLQGSAKKCQNDGKDMTRRTFMNTIYTASDRTPIQQFRTTKTQKGNSGQNSLAASRMNKGSVDMERLLNKIKATNNSREGGYSFREGYTSPYEPGWRENRSVHTQQRGANSRVHERLFGQAQDANYDRYSSKTSLKKNSKRQCILSKFNKIQNGLSLLSERRPELSRDIMDELISLKMRLRLNP